MKLLTLMEYSATASEGTIGLSLCFVLMLKQWDLSIGVILVATAATTNN